MQDEVSQTDPWIAFLSVEGLHNRLSFEINLHPGMNIIYGKNGIGKTTLLHIIANLSEAGHFEELLDFGVMRRPAAAGGPDHAIARV